MEMVETVARAIDPGGWKAYPEPDSEYHRLEIQTLEMRREYSLEKALAAIKAHTECLMEPSEEMVEAGTFTLGYYFRNNKPTECVSDIFQAMLSAQDKPPLDT